MTEFVSRSAIEKAHRTISNHIHRTPLLTNQWISDLLGLDLYFKCENFQKGGAFKIRGATNAVYALVKEKADRGVITHSSGNHAQALAIAAKTRRIKATVVMPENSPAVKVEATKGYGANVILCPPTQEDRLKTCEQIQEKTGATLIHPFDNLDVITGQATVCREVLQDQPETQIVIGPVGGGGLMAGTCLSVKYFGKGIRVFAAEPEGANDTFRSFQSGNRTGNSKVDTIADGLLTDVGELTWPVIKDGVEEVLTVSDRWIKKAQKFFWQRMKIVVEPSGATSLAALWDAVEAGKLNMPAGTKVAVIISGGNCDFPT